MTRSHTLSEIHEILILWTSDKISHINENLLKVAQKISKVITDDWGGSGVFGVEFFVLEKEVIFSELARDHMIQEW